MLFLHVVLFFLFGTSVFAAPSPFRKESVPWPGDESGGEQGPEQGIVRHASPPPMDGAQHERIHWTIPSNAAGFWQRHTGVEHMPPGARPYNVIQVILDPSQGGPKIILWRWHHARRPVLPQYDLETDDQLSLAAGRWVRLPAPNIPPQFAHPAEDLMGQEAEVTYQNHAFRMEITSNHNQHSHT